MCLRNISMGIFVFLFLNGLQSTKYEVKNFLDNLLRTYTYTINYLKNGKICWSDHIYFWLPLSNPRSPLQKCLPKEFTFHNKKDFRFFWVFVVKHENAKDLCVIDYLLMYHPLYGHRKYCRVCYEPMRGRNLVIKIARMEFLKYLFKFHF